MQSPNGKMAPSYDDVESFVKAHEGQPAQPGTGEFTKGKQKFWVPMCTSCGNFSGGKMFGNPDAAFRQAVSHVKQSHKENA